MDDALAKEQPPLHKALQDQLLLLLSEPITTNSLLELQKTAEHARRLLELQNPKAKLARRLSYGGGGIGIVGPNGMDFDAEVDTESSYGDSMSSALSPSPGSETFGASVIRELIPALRNQNKPRLHLSDLMEALGMAKKNDNVELQRKIEAKIEEMLSDDADGDVSIVPRVDCEKCTDLALPGQKLCLKHYDQQAVEAQS